MADGRTREECDGRGQPPLVDILSDTPHFRRPMQARSHDKTRAIITAAHDLLQQFPYSSIRMQDVADRAGCAVTAIYARFADKNGLLDAVHMLRLQESRAILAAEMHQSTLRHTGLRGVADAFVRVNEHHFSVNYNMVRALLSAGDGACFRSFASILDAYALRLATALAEVTGDEVPTLLAPMRFAIRTIMQIYWGGTLSTGHVARPAPETLAQLFVLIVDGRMTE